MSNTVSTSTGGAIKVKIGASTQIKAVPLQDTTRPLIVQGEKNPIIIPGSVMLGIDTTGDYVKTINAGDGISVLPEGGGESANVIISHANTSSEISSNNDILDFIQNIAIDEFGHIVEFTNTSLDSNNFTFNNQIISAKDMFIGTTPISPGSTITNIDGLDRVSVGDISFYDNILSSNGDINVFLSNANNVVNVDNHRIINVSDPLFNGDVVNLSFVNIKLDEIEQEYIAYVDSENANTVNYINDIANNIITTANNNLNFVIDYTDSRIAYTTNFFNSEIANTTNYINSQITDTINYVAVQTANTTNYINSEITNTVNYVDNQITEITDLLLANTTYVDAGLANTVNYINSQITDTINYIDGEIVSTVNYVDGQVANTVINLTSYVDDAIANAANTQYIDDGIANTVNYVDSQIASTIQYIDAQNGLDEAYINAQIANTVTYIDFQNDIDEAYINAQIANTIITLTDDINDTVNYVDVQIANTVNFVNTEINDIASYVDTQIANTVNFVNTEINDITTYVDIQIANTVSFVNTEINDIASYVDTQIANTVNFVNTEISDTVNYVDTQIANTVNFVNAEISDTINYVDVQTANTVTYINDVETNILSKTLDIVEGANTYSMALLSGNPKLTLDSTLNADFANNELTIGLSNIGVTPGIYGNDGFTPRVQITPEGLINFATEVPIELQANAIPDFTETTRDIVGEMFRFNTEEGVQIIHDDLNDIFNVYANNFDIDLIGDISGTAQVNRLTNTTITTTIDANYISNITSGSGIDITGTQGPDSTFNISHSNTSNIANTVNINGNVLSNLTFDEFGHVLSTTETDLDNRYLTLTGGTLTGDIIAPRFVDSNNTDYYIDPASTSRINQLYVGFGGISSRITMQDSEFSSSSLYAGDSKIGFLNTSFNFGVYYDKDTNNWLVDSGSVYTNSLFDVNNTIYFITPSATDSRINGLNIDSSIVFDNNLTIDSNSIQTLSGNLVLQSQSSIISVDNSIITNIVAPVNGSDAINKDYLTAETANTVNFVEQQITNTVNYVDGQVANTVINLTDYIDVNVANTSNILTTYIDNEITNTVNYVDGQVANTVNVLTAYTDNEITNTVNYVDAQIANTAINLTSYVDSEITDTINYVDIQTANTINVLTAYTDNEITDTVNYVDGQVANTVSTLTTYVNNEITNTVNYVDGQVANTVNYVDGQVANTVSTLTTYVNNEITDTVNYVDGQVANTVNVLTSYIDGEINSTVNYVDSQTANTINYIDNAVLNAEANTATSQRLAGDGLDYNISTSAFDVNVDDLTIEISNDILQVKLNGISNDKIVSPFITMSGDIGSNDNVNLGETLTLTGTQSIVTNVTSNQITVSANIANTTSLGVSYFSSENFSTTGQGEVSITTLDGGTF